MEFTKKVPERPGSSKANIENHIHQRPLIVKNDAESIEKKISIEKKTSIERKVVKASEAKVSKIQKVSRNSFK